MFLLLGGTAALAELEAYGLRWRTRDRVVFHAVVVTLRLARRALPVRLSVVPHARRPERRKA